MRRHKRGAVQQVGGAIGLAVLATVALRHAAASVERGVAPGVASATGTVVAFRLGAVILAVGATLVATLFERVVVPRSALG